MSEAARRLREAWDKYKANNGPNKSEPVDGSIYSGDWDDESTSSETMARRERILDAAAEARARGVEPANDPEFTRIVDEERRKTDPSYNPEQLAKIRKSTGGWEPTPEHLEHMQKLQTQMVVDATDRQGRQYEGGEMETMREAAREVDPATGYRPDDEPIPYEADRFVESVPDELLNDSSTVNDSSWSRLQDIPVGSKLDEQGIYTDRD